MKTYVISLARTPERLAEFQRRNAAILPAEVFAAIDGHQASREALLASGVLHATAAYTPGAIGNALSHLSLWDRVAATKEPAIICEDDAILHPVFVAATERLLAGIVGEWDFVAWGWNFDSVLLVDLLPRLGRCLMGFDQAAMRSALPEYLAGPLNPSLFRLKMSFGTVCYAISPRGVRRFRERILPIRALDLRVPGLQRTLPNTALDVMINHFHAALDCYVAFPPLAVTRNDHAGSTVQGGAGTQGAQGAQGAPGSGRGAG